MSLRLETLQVARLAPRLLGDSSALVRDFVLGELTEAGGFRDRDGCSDLYYTVFGIDSLCALQADIPVNTIAAYLGTVDPEQIEDLVHLACLARCWAALPGLEIPADTGASLRARLETFQSGDGGYNDRPGCETGTVYGCFLAFGAYQDLDTAPPGLERMAAFIDTMRTPDGAWANDRIIEVGSTPATAAALALLRHLEHSPPAAAGEWLLARCHPAGGFLANPKAPLPDLLSTATALHALDGLQCSFEHLRERCLDFIDTLWTSRGSFYGHWAEEVLDCEYTFYGLLALGHLSL